MGLGGLWELVMVREACHAAVHGVAKSWTWVSNWTELKDVCVCVHIYLKLVVSGRLYLSICFHVLRLSQRVHENSALGRSGRTVVWVRFYYHILFHTVQTHTHYPHKYSLKSLNCRAGMEPTVSLGGVNWGTDSPEATQLEGETPRHLQGPWTPSTWWAVSPSLTVSTIADSAVTTADFQNLPIT